ADVAPEVHVDGPVEHGPNRCAESVTPQNTGVRVELDSALDEIFLHAERQAERPVAPVLGNVEPAGATHRDLNGTLNVESRARARIAAGRVHPAGRAQPGGAKGRGELPEVGHFLDRFE